MGETHQPPQLPDDWIDIAQRELRDLRGAYRGGSSNVAKVGHALHAVEAVLKAIIWKKNRWNAWPTQTSSNQYRYLYHHDLVEMLKQAGLTEALLQHEALSVSWRVLVNARTRQNRYSAQDVPDDDANAIAKSARHPDEGIVPWLLKTYRTMM